MQLSRLERQRIYLFSQRLRVLIENNLYVTNNLAASLEDSAIRGIN